jgi:MFS family permease
MMMAAPFIGNLFSPLWARQMEGREKLPFCLGSWSIARSLLFLMPFAATGQAFVALIGGLQIIGTVSAPAYTSLMRDIYPDHARGRLMGYVRVVVQSMMFLATLIAGRLYDHGISFRILFPLAAVFGIGAAVFFRHVRPLPHVGASPGEAPETVRGHGAFVRQTVGILKHNRAYRYFALSVFVYGFANLMVQPLYGLFQVDVLRITSTQIANLANFASLWSIAGAFFWGRFMDRKGAPFTVMCSICLIALIPVVYLFARSVPMLFFAAALSGSGFAGIELSYLASILLYAERDRTAQYQSLHSLLLGVRGVLAPLLGVPLAKAFGYPPVFAGALAVMLVGAALQGMAIRATR